MMMKLSALLLVSLAVRSHAATGFAMITGTTPSSPVYGTVKLEDTGAGLKITAELSGLTPGDHGFHIHEFGLCSEAGKAAGSHYNPNKTAHGDAVKSGVKHAHAGDMGNAKAGADGKAMLQVVIPKVTLNGKYPVAGRAFIVHEKADDFGQPVGNAGGRLGCGVISVTGE
jgi:Cu-Zn family superoxide dismutase